MIWHILIAFFVILLLWILLVPVVLTLDTSSNQYRLMLPGVISVAMVPEAGFFNIRGWIFFVPFRLDPIKMGKSRRERKKGKKDGKKPGKDGVKLEKDVINRMKDGEKPGKDAKKREKSRKKKKNKQSRKKGLKSIKKFRKMARAIRVRRLELDVDTDDYLLNAWLVPAFTAVNSYDNVQMQVNFEGHLFLHLEVRTRVGAVMWQMLPWRS